ncbi:MAG TPA: AgmX/PglI C-terminal domain-containing protein [Polyangiales bacterium]
MSCAFRSNWLCLALIAAAGCGASRPALNAPVWPAQPAAPLVAQTVAAAEPPVPRPTVKIKGLSGTLNKDDVHQTMDERQPALDGCIGESRKRLRWVSGTIRFAFKVAADGHVDEVYATESSIGHRALEQCITDVVATTIFPKPAGLATAKFEWGLTVDPANGRLPDDFDADRLEPLLRKHVAKIFRTCKVRRPRERFQVTAYIAPDGRVLSAGAVPNLPRAADKVGCVLDELSNLRMPRPRRCAKVAFELR